MLMIGAHPSVAAVLADEESHAVAELEREYRVKMVIKPDATLHIEQYDIVML
jgi:Ribonuclease G/E